MKRLFKWCYMVVSMLMMIASFAVSSVTAFAATSYFTRPGDTLWNIAHTYHVSVSELKRANQLSSDLIQIHQRLKIPTPDRLTPHHVKPHPQASQAIPQRSGNNNANPHWSAPVHKITHQVMPGDTLWQIAADNNTTVARLVSLNHLTSDWIYPGKQLIVEEISDTAWRQYQLTKLKKVGVPLHLVPVYQAAGRQFGIPWTVLAAIHKVETHFSTGRVVSPAGAQGPMQFMPATFAHYGVTAPGRQGPPDMNNVFDAIFSCAHMLAADGYRQNPTQALYLYNHSTVYVQTVQSYAHEM